VKPWQPARRSRDVVPIPAGARVSERCRADATDIRRGPTCWAPSVFLDRLGCPFQEVSMTTSKPRELGFETIALHGGHSPDQDTRSTRSGG